MKKNKKIQAQKIEKTNLVEGINNLIEEKTQKVEKSKKALKAEAKKEETPEAAKEKKVKKTQKEKLVDKTKKKVEANLVEEVVTKREVKYIYPADGPKQDSSAGAGNAPNRGPGLQGVQESKEGVPRVQEPIRQGIRCNLIFHSRRGVQD
jgi:hypothetical protein